MPLVLPPLFLPLVTTCTARSSPHCTSPRRAAPAVALVAAPTTSTRLLDCADARTPTLSSSPPSSALGVTPDSSSCTRSCASPAPLAFASTSPSLAAPLSSCCAWCAPAGSRRARPSSSRLSCRGNDGRLAIGGCVSPVHARSRDEERVERERERAGCTLYCRGSRRPSCVWAQAARRRAARAGWTTSGGAAGRALRARPAAVLISLGACSHAQPALSSVQLPCHSDSSHQQPCLHPHPRQPSAPSRPRPLLRRRPLPRPPPTTRTRSASSSPSRTRSRSLPSSSRPPPRPLQPTTARPPLLPARPSPPTTTRSSPASPASARASRPSLAAQRRPARSTSSPSSARTASQS